MKLFIILIWLILPLAFATYHFTKGEKLVVKDQAQELIDQAYSAVDKENYDEAVELFSKALSKLTDQEKSTLRKIRLDRAKAMFQCSQLPKAREEIQALITDLQDDKDADPALLRDARATFAYSRYYMTYLMKLEALPKADWEPEIEAARQEYKLLSQQSSGEESTRYAKDLEASIKLARAELTDLTGVAIPKP